MLPTDAVMERRILREQNIIATVARLNASEEVEFLYSVEFPIYRARLPFSHIYCTQT